MEERSKNGHRQRMRKSYMVGGADAMDDCKLLELYLSLIIPRHDVRELSYDLINTFGSLQGVFGANVAQLMNVNGVGENTAVMITLTKDLQNRMLSSDKSITSADDVKKYILSRLSNLSIEKMLVVALDSKGKFIGDLLITGFGSNYLDVNPKQIVQFLINCNASGVILGHNHPNGYCSPSGSDCDFTLKIRNLMRGISVRLVDHIIVGDDGALSMRSTAEYKGFFD